jgi:hypothetical protein
MQVKWLRNVIVGAQVEPHDFSLGIGDSRKEDNRYFCRLGEVLQDVTDVEPADTWHHHVEQNDIGLPFARLCYGLHPTGCRIYAVTLVSEVFLQEHNQIWLVIDDQYAKLFLAHASDTFIRNCGRSRLPAKYCSQSLEARRFGTVAPKPCWSLNEDDNAG